MAIENRLWGAERIHGELLNLGLRVAKGTIQKYIARLRPSQLPSQNWSIFLKNHAKDVWACDFLPVIDLFFHPLYLSFIVELASRRVVHFGVARSPTDEWFAQQLREATPFGQGPRFLIRDRDRNPTRGEAFKRAAESASIEILKTHYRAPKANAICERFLGSVWRECLDHMIFLGERHLYRLVNEYIAYFHQARLHQGIGQEIPEGLADRPEKRGKGRILAFSVLNGLQHDYRLAA